MKFKTARINEEWESGELNKTLTEKVKLWEQWLKYIAPGYEPTITDIWRSRQEYKDVYNNPDKKPGIHHYWRAIDFRTNDMPTNLASRSAEFFNTIPYDRNRPHLKTCLYGDERHLDHLHLQECYKG